MEQTTTPITQPNYMGESDEVRALLASMRGRVPRDAAKRLVPEDDAVIADVLERLPAPQALAILDEFEPARRDAVRSQVAPHELAQWQVNATYPQDTLGRIMEWPAGVVRPEITVGEAVERLREEVKKSFITYLYVTGADGRLQGLVVMRELLLADRATPVSEVMLRDPFSLPPEMSVAEAMQKAVARHFPVYPICDTDGRLIGLVRGDDLFEQNIVRVVVQAGSMVGVEKEERITTSWRRSLRMRHPWLQLNLVTAIVAGAVVGLFENTIDQIVVLAAFLPVLAGQSGNTGCQALAVTLRGMTLGDLDDRRPLAVVTKEAMLGLVNGVIVGVVAGVLMYFYARRGGNEHAFLLGIVVVLAMAGSCVMSGVCGSLVPIGLRKLGADPATASSIFLTTATDVVSMGLLLSLASLIVL